MKWIKASERLPEKKGDYIIKYRDERGDPRNATMDYFNGAVFAVGNLAYVWLDESLPPVSEDVEGAAKEYATHTVKGAVPWDQFDRTKYNAFLAGASWQSQLGREDEQDAFAIGFAAWALYSPDAERYKAAGISAQGLLEKYKSRPFVDNDNPKQ